MPAHRFLFKQNNFHKILEQARKTVKNNFNTQLSVDGISGFSYRPFIGSNQRFGTSVFSVGAAVLLGWDTLLGV